jgi:hypothetical protein
MIMDFICRFIFYATGGLAIWVMVDSLLDEGDFPWL